MKTQKWIRDLEKKIDDEDPLKLLATIMEELPVPVHPIYGLYSVEEHDLEAKVLPQQLLEEYTFAEINLLEELLPKLYKRTEEEAGYFAESFVMTYTMALFERQVLTDFGGVAPYDVGIPMNILVEYDGDMTYEDKVDMTLGCATRFSQRAIQKFAQAGVSGFELDSRGFMAVDSTKVPDEIHFFLGFLKANADRMNGVVKDIHEGADMEELRSESIEEHLATFVDIPEDYKQTGMFDLDDDPDSDNNDDEVVRW